MGDEYFRRLVRAARSESERPGYAEQDRIDAQRYRQLKRLYATANGYWFQHVERLSSKEFDAAVDALPDPEGG
jgi:hypothetical protein